VTGLNTCALKIISTIHRVSKEMSSKYGTWTIEKLKAELRKRQAKLSGRKQELIDQ
jgi:hypothetical protein